MLPHSTRPKLALSVPTTASTALTAKSPVRRPPVSPSPVSPTARNTRLNQRGLSTLQVPSFSYAQTSDTKSILKKGAPASNSKEKKLQFCEEPAVKCVTPVPDDYHGTYVKMSKDERRWGRDNRA